MTPEERKDLEAVFRKYAWDYFSVHAAQRLTGFQFYITLATALVGGYLVLIADEDTRRLAFVVGLLLVFLSFVFFKLDQRTARLIKNAEQALNSLDELYLLPDGDDGLPHVFRLFARDDAKRKAETKRGLLLNRHSYTTCFRAVFVGFSAIGLASGIYAIATTGHEKKKADSKVVIINSDTSAKENDNNLSMGLEEHLDDARTRGRVKAGAHDKQLRH